METTVRYRSSGIRDVAMTRLTEISDRYRAAAVMMGAEAELHAVADDVGAQLDASLRRLIARLRQDAPDDWQDLLAIAKQLRWRLATNPAPAEFRSGDDEIVSALVSECDRRKHGAEEATQLLLSDLADRAERSRGGDRPSGVILLESLSELNFESCVVVAASRSVQYALRQWFDSLEIAVPVLSTTFRAQEHVVNQAYVVGSPSLFAPALASAPRAERLAYVLPSWVRDRTLPRSSFSDYAEGAIAPSLKTFLIGLEPVVNGAPVVADDQLVPQPVWSPTSSPQSARLGETLARKVLLAGGLAIMLDQSGEHIRSLYPERPQGKRVELGDVSAVTVGSYLVLREGSTDSEMLYEQAIALLGERGPAARSSQEEWKSALRREVVRMGVSEVERSLGKAGVKRADRAPAWISATMVRPQDDNDFALLLQWLGLPKQPHYGLAADLRRARLQASADIRERLEEAMSTVDLGELNRAGFQRLELDIPGFRSIIATGVLAMSPVLQSVHRREIRRPFKDAGAQWLE